MKNKIYVFTLEIRGTATVEVKAKSKSEALKKFQKLDTHKESLEDWDYDLPWSFDEYDEENLEKFLLFEEKE